MPPRCGERGPRGEGTPRSRTRLHMLCHGSVAFGGPGLGLGGSLDVGDPHPSPCQHRGCSACVGQGGSVTPSPPWSPGSLGSAARAPLGGCSPQPPPWRWSPPCPRRPPLCAVPRCQRVSLATGPLGHRGTIHSRHRAGVAGTVACPRGAPCSGHGQQGHRVPTGCKVQPVCPQGAWDVAGTARTSPRGPRHGREVPMGCRTQVAWPGH